MTTEGLDRGAEQQGDAELIAAVRSGNPSSFELLYDRHATAAMTVARRYTDSAADAEDVVSESFTAVYSALQAGNGPTEAFRAYLFTVVRRVAAARRDRGRAERPTDDLATLEIGSTPMAGADDPALAGFEKSLVARAFQSLPERWQLVLWHCEVEGHSPAEVAPLLGLTANSTAALAYRAREGLRQAYLTEHLAEPSDAACREVADKLGGYVRGGLGSRDSARVEAHLDDCVRCRALVVELGDVNRGMRGVIAPLVLGVAGLGALAKGLPLAGGLVAVPLAGALAGHVAGAAGAGTTGAGVATAGGAGAGGSGGAGSGGVGGASAGAAGGGAAGGGAATAGGLLGILVSIPPAVSAAAAVLVVVAVGVAVAVHLMSGDGATEQAVAPSSVGPVVQSAAPAPVTSPAATTSSTPSVAPSASAAPTASVTPTASATPTASTTPTPTATATPSATPAPGAADVQVVMPADGLVLTAGTTQSMTVTLINVGGSPASDLSAAVTLPAGVSLAAATGTSGGRTAARLPAATSAWTCAGANTQATCALATLDAGASSSLTLSVAVDESYDSTSGTVAVRIQGVGVDVSSRSIPVTVAASPARVDLRQVVSSVQLVAGRTRTLSLQVANEGGTSTTAALPADVTVTLPAGVSQTDPHPGDWTCGTGTGTITCTSPLARRSVSTLTLQLATAAGTAPTSGTVSVGFGPTGRVGSATVGYQVVTPAIVQADVGAVGALALGSVTDVPVTVTNSGGLSAASTVATLTLPAGAAWADVAATGTGWTCTASDATLTCARGSLAAGASAGFTAHLTAVAGEFGALGALTSAAQASDADAGPAASVALTATAPGISVDATDARLMLADKQAGTVRFAVDVAVGADASGVVATVTLPRTVAYAPDTSSETPGCTQGSSTRVVVCDLGYLTAGSSTAVVIPVSASGVAVSGSTAIAVVADGGVTASGKAPAVAASGGLVPRAAFFGDVAVTQAGAPVLTCQRSTACRIALSGKANNNNVTMIPLDQTPPATGGRPAVAVSSSTTLTVPGAQAVLWAGLYWSANRYGADGWSTSTTAAKLAGPDGGYQAVTGEQIATVVDGSGRTYYQSFADVTSQVAAQGSGTWSVADVAVAAGRTDPSPNYYAGWALVVVYGTAGDPDTASRSATVYDGSAWVSTVTTTPVFDFAVAAGTRANIGVVAWEGDAASTGDQLKLDGTALTPVEGRGGVGSATNAFDSWADGWSAVNSSTVVDSLGLDVKQFAPATMPHDVAALTPTTTGDQYLLGVVTVSGDLPDGPSDAPANAF